MHKSSILLSIFVLVLSSCNTEIRTKEFAHKKVPVDNKRYLQEQQDQDLKVNDRVAQTQYQFNDSENTINQGRQFSYEERRAVPNPGEYQRITSKPKSNSGEMDRLYPIELPQDYDGNIQERRYRVYDDECPECGDDMVPYDDQYEPEYPTVQRKKMRDEYRTRPVEKKIVKKRKPQIVNIRPKKNMQPRRRQPVDHNIVDAHSSGVDETLSHPVVGHQAPASAAPMVPAQSSDLSHPALAAPGNIPSHLPTPTPQSVDVTKAHPNLPAIPVSASSRSKAVSMPAPADANDDSTPEDHQDIQQVIEKKALSDKTSNLPQAGTAPAPSGVVAKSKPISPQEVQVAVGATKGPLNQGQGTSDNANDATGVSTTNNVQSSLLPPPPLPN